MKKAHIPIEEQKFPIIAKCDGCSLREGNFCIIYRVPEAKWSYGICPMATHKKKIEQEAKLVDPLKASKRKARGR